ncbi:hypothetical protein DFQ26_000496, partial [Actinomortierella ambigua]
EDRRRTAKRQLGSDRGAQESSHESRDEPGDDFEEVSDDNSSNGNSSSSSNSNSGRGSDSGSGSTKLLSLTQIAQMQVLFQMNYDRFRGEDWVMPSGASFDWVLFGAIRNIHYECPLYSFVIENPDAVISLFTDARDKAELKRVLIDRVEEQLPTLTAVEMAYLELFKKEPDELRELFAEKGWRAVGDSLQEKPSDDFQRVVYESMHQILKVYRGVRMIVPKGSSESWIVNRLWGFLADAWLSPPRVEFHPGEVHSQASMCRRNLGRSRHTPLAAGHKVNGIVALAGREIELLVIEAAKKNEGRTGTEALDDRMKLCKLTKDMHDRIRLRTRQNVRKSIVTFGMQISGVNATFFTLRQRDGRFYQLCSEGRSRLPSVWTDKTDTKAVIQTLTKVLSIRKALLSMANDVSEFTAGLVNDSETGSGEDFVVATMTSPQLIPSSPTLAL